MKNILKKTIHENTNLLLSHQKKCPNARDLLFEKISIILWGNLAQVPYPWLCFSFRFPRFCKSPRCYEWSKDSFANHKCLLVCKTGKAQFSFLTGKNTQIYCFTDSLLPIKWPHLFTAVSKLVNATREWFLGNESGTWKRDLLVKIESQCEVTTGSARLNREKLP